MNFDSYFIIETENFIPKSKVASFDLDWTIIRPKGNTVFPKDNNDWVIFPKILTFIREKHMGGYCIVIFTNQKNVDRNLFKTKIENISNHLKVPLLLYGSTKNDLYRKPSVGMWEKMCEKIGDVNTDESFYIGDAAGRRGDFSDTDYKFAINNKIKFYAISHGEMDVQGKSINFPKHPMNGVSNIPTHVEDCDEQEMIILVGPPACSKSSWSEDYVKSHDNYVIACQDDLHTKPKLIKFINSEIKKRKSIIIDRQNEKVKTRKEFIDIAKASGMKVRILWFDVPKEIVEHLNMYRKITTGKDIPNVAYNKFYSEKEGVGLEAPNTHEEVDEIVMMKFSISEDNIKDKKLFYSYLV